MAADHASQRSQRRRFFGGDETAIVSDINFLKIKRSLPQVQRLMEQSYIRVKLSVTCPMVAIKFSSCPGGDLNAVRSSHWLLTYATIYQSANEIQCHDCRSGCIKAAGGGITGATCRLEGKGKTRTLDKICLAHGSACGSALCRLSLLPSFFFSSRKTKAETIVHPPRIKNVR